VWLTLSFSFQNPPFLYQNRPKITQNRPKTPQKRPFSHQIPQQTGGGGAIEMELSRRLRDHSRTIAGKDQLIIGAFAKALEVRAAVAGWQWFWHRWMQRELAVILMPESLAMVVYWQC
jgi:hypothetical protein